MLIIQVAKERLKQVITQAGEEDFSELSLDHPQIGDFVSSKLILLNSCYL